MGDAVAARAEGARPSAVSSESKLKLGLFGVNTSYGIVMSDVSAHAAPTWQDQLDIAKLADDMGMELMVPIGRWKGFGGRLDFNGHCYETYAWAAGIAQATENITIFATSHLPTIHPIAAAKAATTIDHISGGRFGLNLVMGWFTPEMEMFGGKQRPHDERYQFGFEWVDLVTRLWTEDEPFDYDGTYFQIKGAQAFPKPVQKPRPVLVNAGASPAGVDFSARVADFNFITINTVEELPEDIRKIREKGRGYGRDLDVMAAALLICRDTQEEAQAAYDAILEHGDLEGAYNLGSVLGVESQSFGDTLSKFQERIIAGWANYPMVGTPESITADLLEISQAGMDGLVFGFIDYKEDLKYFEAKVMPLLREAGLRA
jgi:FMNH2-dependent dimethyl sulfone monooxygenase